MSDTMRAESLLIITGSMGAGKTAVLAEASDLLGRRHVVHAAIDVDALGLAHLPDSASTDHVMYENLRSAYQNFAAAGVRRFLLARAIEDRGQLEICRQAIPSSSTRVCRLTAGIETMRRRVESRESGLLRSEYIARVEVLNAVLDRASLEDFSVPNESRPLTHVALEMLLKARWLLE